jgi:hypothetical protein
MEHFHCDMSWKIAHVEATRQSQKLMYMHLFSAIMWSCSGQQQMKLCWLTTKITFYDDDIYSS